MFSELIDCDFNVTGLANEILRRHYGIDGVADISQNDQNSDEILFHINFREQGERVVNVPRNVTIEIIYNSSILNATMIEHPDPISLGLSGHQM